MEVDLSGPVFTISNVILYAMMMTSANILLKTRFARIPTFIAEFVSIIGYYAVTNLFSLSVEYRIPLAFLYLVLVIEVAHRGEWFYKLLVIALIYVAMVFSEILYVMLIPKELTLDHDLFNQHAVSIFAFYLFVNLVMQTLVVIALLVTQKRYQGLLLGKQWLLFPIFPISQVLAFSGWFSSYLVSDTIVAPGRVIPTLLFCIAADFSVILTIWRTARTTELSVRNELLEEQIGSEESYYKQLSSTFEDIRTMRHDIDNHLYTMQTLLEEGQMEEAKDYVRKMKDEDHAKLLLPGCHNTVVASYLEKKMADFQSDGLRLATDVSLPSNLSVTNPDLICIFGNLLNNAQEACQAMPDADIHLSVTYHEPYLRIVCTNPLANDLQGQSDEQKKRRIPELERGIGHSILRTMAERYDGQFRTETTGQSYEAEVILKTRKE